ncbi:hypothetical protein ACFXG3_35375, partial [Nocardia tengchongensis]
TGPDATNLALHPEVATGYRTGMTPVRTGGFAEAGIGQAALDEVVSDAVAIHRCARAEIRSASAALEPAIAARLHRALSRAQEDSR